MEVKMMQDDMGTHLDWQHDGVTPKMIDWFWSNMEKGFLLWHPEEHEPLSWAVPVKHGNPIHAIHIAPQTWSDGTRQNLYLRFEDLDDVPDNVKEYIVYDHVILVNCIGLGEKSLENPEVWGYRIHQWSGTDFGVVGKSNAIGMAKKETKEQGQVWAKHCQQEIGNWGVFLPQLYELFKPVVNTAFNPYTNLSVVGKGANVKYKYIQK